MDPQITHGFFGSESLAHASPATGSPAIDMSKGVDGSFVSAPADIQEQISDIHRISKAIFEYRGYDNSSQAKSAKKIRKRTLRLVRKTIQGETFPVQRQGESEDSDVWAGLYGLYGLIEPRYKFVDLMDIVEESHTLQSCIQAMIEGVDGGGHDFSFLGDDKTEKDAPEEKAALVALANFFDDVNDDGSFINVRKRVRYDLEAAGNGAMEVVRNLIGEVEQIWHLPITYCRMTLPDSEETEYEITLMRKGKPIPVTRRKRFRRYARYLPTQPYSIKWFKEFGDPRVMDSRTGEFQHEVSGPIPVEHRATELWWFKIPFRNMDYGAPRYVGCLTTIKGAVLAEFVNYDLFNNQGIPPLLLIAEGGHFTDNSLDEIENTLESWRDPAKFNRTCLIEVEGNEVGLGEAGTTKVSVKIERLREARVEDYMFGKFLDWAEAVIRRCWRLPPLLQGGTSDYNLATAYASQTTAEQQIFVPLRMEFDEQIKLRLIRREFNIWNWAFKSKGPQVVGSEELTKMFSIISRAGAGSMNDNIEFMNRYLGTNISVSDAPLMKAPSMVVNALARLGRIAIDETGNLVLLAPQEATGAVPLDGDGTGDDTGTNGNNRANGNGEGDGEGGENGNDEQNTGGTPINHNGVGTSQPQKSAAQLSLLTAMQDVWDESQVVNG